MIPLSIFGRNSLCFIILSAHTTRNQYKMLENVPYLSVCMISWIKTSVTLQNCNSSTNLFPQSQVHSSQLPQNTFLGIKKGTLGGYSLSETYHLRNAKSHPSFKLSYCLDLQRVVSLDGEGTVSPSPEKGWVGGGGRVLLFSR